MFVYPSLYEGFGFPVLEAMACGCPVIANNVSSLPEILGKSGVLVDPKASLKELIQSIKKILKSSYTEKKLTGEGLERAKEFSWQKTSEQTLKVYENLFLKK